ncbi:MAG TPA: hypothetical protein VFK04_19725 [Gemmatimonadaceae bacterium]|nr:hypothetical protein [Gemmatimonadaceae bacterium]
MPPSAEAPEGVVPAGLEEQAAIAQPEVGASDAIAPPEGEVHASDAIAPPETEAWNALTEPEVEAPRESAQVETRAEETVVSPSLPEPSGEPPVDSTLPLELEQAASDAFGRFDPLAFDDGADGFVVQSLETEPISLAPSDVSGMDVQIDSTMGAPVDPLEGVAPAGFSDALDYDFPPGVDRDVIESIESYLADDSMVVEHTPGFESAAVSDEATLVEGASPDDVVQQGAMPDYLHEHDATLNYDDRAQVHDDAPIAGNVALVESDAALADGDTALAADDSAPIADHADSVGGAAEEQRAEIDPWAGAELPEPAFGSIGWPSTETVALAAEQPVEGVDEMSAALAWSDADGPAGEHGSPAGQANGEDVSSDDALSAMAHELRDSSSAWVVDARVVDDSDDVSARARFYGGGERSPSFPGDQDAAVDPDATPEAGSYAGELVELTAAEVADDAAGDAAAAAALGDGIGDTEGDDAGAAIADALARVAARIRAGEVDLPSEVVGASDESALAAALAALLRGPRR